MDEKTFDDPRFALNRTYAKMKRVQHELFNLGSILAARPEDVHERQACITSVEVASSNAKTTDSSR